MPSPLMRTTLPGTAREMPWHEVRQVIASTTGRGTAAEAAVCAVGAGACVGALPPVGAGVCASAAEGTASAAKAPRTSERRNDAIAKDRRKAAMRTGGRAGRSTDRLTAYGVS